VPNDGYLKLELWLSVQDSRVSQGAPQWSKA